MSDDDWFERALREADAAEDDSTTGESDAAADERDPGDGGSTSANGERDPGDGEPAGVDGERDPGGGGSTSADGEHGSADGATNGRNRGSEPGSETESASTDETDTGEGTDPFGGPSFGVEDDGDGDGGDSSPFTQDFASALSEAPDPSGGGGSEFGVAEVDAGGSGEGLGMGGGGEFGTGGGEFGMGGGNSFESQFDEDEFESGIDRIEIGIEGLDEMILGGVPERSLMVAIGSAGTGKTTFGLQFLHRTLSEGNNAVYITLEETRQRVLDTADEKGWEFNEYADDGQLVVVDLDPIDMANSLSSIRNDLPRLVEDFGADRLVLDSVSLLEMMYDHPSKRRSEVFGFTRELKKAGVTTMLTSEASEDSPYASRHGLVEYLADAVFVLQYVRPDDFRETRLAIEIQKIRDANHSRETKPYEITNEGISVYRQANIF